MKAVVFDHYGDADVLQVREVADPRPGPGELLIQVKAAGLNRADILQRKGFYPPPKGASTIPGLEIAGTVVELGDGCESFKVGQRVFGLVEGGGYGSLCTINERLAMPIPDGWEDSFAAAIPETFFTASEALFTLGNLISGEEVLIQAGGSGVGSTAIQMAKAVGARVATTSSSSEKLRACAQLGADLCIPYKETDFVTEVRAWSEGAGAHLVLDFVGAAYLERHLDVLREKGRLIVIGLLGGLKAELNLSKVLSKRIKIEGSVMRGISVKEKEAIKDRFLQRWMPELMEGRLKPVIYEKIPLENVQDAHKMVEASQHFGKVVLTFL